MSDLPSNELACLEGEPPSIELAIDASPRDLGDFTVRRALPSMRRRLVGPFIFFDHMGPAEMPPGEGMAVRAHPHIGLATITYLFDGEIMHRDSVGSESAIRPGDVSWMVAGRGIAHSERSSPEARAAGVRIHGIQSWVALPSDREEVEPRFEHHGVASMPRVRLDRVVLDVIAGTAYGQRSPVGVLSPTLYVHARLDAGAQLPVDDARGRREARGAAPHLVELRVELAGTHRASKGRVARASLRAGEERRRGVHPAARAADSARAKRRRRRGYFSAIRVPSTFTWKSSY